MMHCGLKALHGFLGIPSDWQSLGIECEAVDLWRDLAALPKGAPFRIWSQVFNERVRRSGERPVLMGYSMGGRLAMSAVLSDPSLYRGLVLVSANPGISEGRAARAANDAKWAEKFLHEDWVTVLREWNEQPVFKSTHGVELARPESSFALPLLARALREWSLSEQPDFRQALPELKLPVLYITGSDDAKFTSMMRGMKMGAAHKLVTLENAGHRAPWDQPEAFARTLRDFLATV